MSTCNCFDCQCGILLDENKISEQTYYGMLLGYYFASYVKSRRYEDIFKKYGLKPTNIDDKDTIGGEIARTESNTGFAKHGLEEYRKQYKIFDELVAKALGEKK